ncbi:MAG: HAE1 family hydrophobic/amphiphilic exporter-1 [Polyangiales bacterium]|jgi:HAE1 family hydrophobic/amphiphilic exporter-1
MRRRPMRRRPMRRGPRPPVSDEQREGGLLKLAISRPVSVAVGVILVVLFGVRALNDLPIQLTPDLSIPRLTVRTSWPGASPEDIEREILVPQENALKRLTGLVEMTSSANANAGSLTLELELGTDINEALVRATNRLQEVGDYPEGSDQPVVETADDSGPPLAVIAIRREGGGAVAAYRTWVEDRILPELQRVEGVGDIRLLGGQDTVMRVDFDPTDLAARGISVQTLITQIRSELNDVSGGDVEVGRRRLLLRTMALEPSPEALASLVIAAAEDGTPLRLSDVAQVSLGLREAQAVAFSDDRPSMVMLLSREAGSNVLEVTQQIRSVVEELDEGRFAQEGLRIEVISDQIDYIEGALSLVQQNLLLGGILAILVLLLFLRSIGASAIIAVAIPVCVFGTGLGMTWLGRSVNVVSLAGITFAIGMVLDNSIVALESIDTWRKKTSDPREAALLGIKEVAGALVASTATTAAVFIPVIAWQDEVGQLLKDVAVAITFAVSMSLLVSVLVIPALAAKLPQKKRSEGQPTKNGWLDALKDRTARFVRALVDSRVRSSLIVGFAVGASVAFAWFMLPPLEYLPKGNRNLVFGVLVPPPGTSVSDLDTVARTVQGRVQRESGQGDAPTVARSFFVGGTSRLFAGAVAEDPNQVTEMQNWLRGVQSSIPGYFSFTSQASLFGRAGGGRTIDLRLTGADLGRLTAVGGTLFGRIRETMPGTQVRPQPSLDPGAPELRVRLRRDEAASQLLTTASLGLVVDALVDGTFVGELAPPGRPTIDVIVSGMRDGESIEGSDAIRSLPVVTPAGDVVPLASLARISEELGPTVIQRIERDRAITLQIGPPDDVPLETALADIETLVAEMGEAGELSGVETDIAGTAGDLEVAKGRFANVLLLALLISYLLLAALFEDFLAPVVILVTLPLAAAGGVGGLRLVDAFLEPQPLDLMTALGFLILIGVVVNNAILVVDGALAGLRRGEELEEAIEEAVRSRVRPILMTAMTSIAGLAPMVLLGGAGSEIYRGVGAIVLGGLAFGTLLTVLVVPCLFALVWRVRLGLKKSVVDA